MIERTFVEMDEETDDCRSSELKETAVLNLSWMSIEIYSPLDCGDSRAKCTGNCVHIRESWSRSSGSRRAWFTIRDRRWERGNIQ